MNHIKMLDSALANYIARLPKWLERPFSLLSLATSPIVWMLGMFALALASVGTATINVLIFIGLPLAALFKLGFRRKRPPTIYAGKMRIKSYSFPSSHAYAAALGGGYLAILALPDWPLSLVALLLAGVVGVSRVYLGAHYPTDVIAGWALGAALLIVAQLVGPVLTG